VLNDWDLSYDDRRGSEVGHVVGGEKTGTLPFMALDLLSKKAWTGNFQRLYRHDLEGFIWILPWVFLQFQGGTREFYTLQEWQNGNYEACARAKRSMLSELLRAQDIATPSWKAEWQLAITLLCWLRIEELKREMAVEMAPPLSASPKEVFDAFCQLLWDSRIHYPPLEKIMRDLELAPI